MRKIFIISSMLLSYVVAKADLLYVEPFVAKQPVSYKENQRLSVFIESSNDYVACQFDLYLPIGITISTSSTYWSFGDIIPEIYSEDDEEYIPIGEVKINSKTDSQGKKYFQISYANEDELPFTSKVGSVLTFCYKSDATLAEGIHDIQIKNVVLAIDGYHDVKPTDATSHVYVAPFDLSFREGYGTFVAPFDVTLPEDVKAFADGEVVEDIYKLGEPMTTIPANTPVFVKGESATTVRFKEAPEIKFEQASATNGYMIGAVVAPVEAPTNSYVLQKHDGDKDVKLYRVSKENPIALTIDKCCLSLPESLNAPAALRFWDEETGIIQIESESTSPSMTYDLMGRPAQNGFLIKHNKKYIVK